MSELREDIKAQLQELSEDQLVDVITNLKYPEGTDKEELVNEILDLYDTTVKEGNIPEEDVHSEVLDVIDEITSEPPEHD